MTKPAAASARALVLLRGRLPPWTKIIGSRHACNVSTYSSLIETFFSPAIIAGLGDSVQGLPINFFGDFQKSVVATTHRISKHLSFIRYDADFEEDDMVGP